MVKHQEYIQSISDSSKVLPLEMCEKVVYYMYTYTFEDQGEFKKAVDNYPKNINIYGNISFWDVSKIKNMENIYHNRLNGDILLWDVSNVIKWNTYDETLRNVLAVIHPPLHLLSLYFCDILYSPPSNREISNISDMPIPHFDDSLISSIWEISDISDMPIPHFDTSYVGDISDWVISDLDITPPQIHTPRVHTHTDRGWWGRHETKIKHKFRGR
jgi:hypothetical protein